MLLVHLFVYLDYVSFCPLSLSCCRGLASDCDCDTPWNFIYLFECVFLTFPEGWQSEPLIGDDDPNERFLLPDLREGWHLLCSINTYIMDDHGKLNTTANGKKYKQGRLHFISGYEVNSKWLLP